MDEDADEGFIGNEGGGGFKTIYEKRDEDCL